MREEIWTEKIFKDDADYFLRITYLCDGFFDGSFQQLMVDNL